MAYCSWIACVFRMTLEDVTDLPPCCPHEVTGPAWKPHVMWLSLNPFNSTSVTLIKCKLKTTCTSLKAKHFLITAHTCKRWILNGIAYRSCHSTPQPAVHGRWCLIMWLLLISLSLSREPLPNLTFGVISCLHIWKNKQKEFSAAAFSPTFCCLPLEISINDWGANDYLTFNRSGIVTLSVKASQSQSGECARKLDFHPTV